jgi:hypothetical protein
MTSAIAKKSRFGAVDYASRPRDYDPRLAEKILDRVMNGEVLTDICLDQDYPLPGMFLAWVDENKDLEEAYARAKRIGAEVTFDEVVSAAHDTDTFRGRLRSDALKFRVERSLPDKYGPRSTVRNAEAKDEAAGIDHGAEIRRKLDQMAQRLAPPASADGAADGGTPG